MRSRFLCAAGLAIVSAACASQPASPARPDRYDASPLNGPVTLRGSVTATNGGQMLPGIYVDANGRVLATDTNGMFALETPAANPLRLSFTGSSIIPRTVSVAADSSRTVAVEAIAAAGFDLTHYQQMARNASHGPMLPLRRWTNAPVVYLMVNDEAGTPVPAQTLAVTEQAIRETMPIFSGGQFQARIERVTTRGPLGGFTVRWPVSQPEDRCGQADVAQDGGIVDLFYMKTACQCPGVSLIRAGTVRHEIGHAMGFYHTSNPADVMSSQGRTACDYLPTDRERLAARIAYSRPVGNLDPDVDPASSMSVTPTTVVVP